MRITFLLPGFSWKPMGGFKVVYQYANQLVSRGHQVTVVHPESLPGYGEPQARTRRSFRDVLRRWRTLYWSRVLFPRIPWVRIDPRVKMLSVAKPDSRLIPDADAIFASAWITAELVLGYPECKGEKFYLIQHYETWDGPKERVDATWRAPLKKVVIAKWLHELGMSLGCPESELAYIPNGLDHTMLRLFNPIAGRGKRLAMAFFPWLSWKGPADGLAAVEIAKRRYPDLAATFFSISRRPSSLPRWIGYWRNPPQRALIDDIYNRSSIFVCPSWVEGFPLPPAEAMACGCAVAATDIAGIREYATHGATALLSPARDPESLANNIIRLLSDEDFRVEVARAGNEHIRSFTWQRSTTLLEAFLAGNPVAASTTAVV
ncbi:MAG: glycosyltransferase family 4 protein [Terriglobia bacterium]